MPLYTQTIGSGPDLVLIHGWGLHGGIWDGLLPGLQAHYRVCCVDLPGHGFSPWQGEQALEEVTAAVLEVAPPQAGWAGWSLGGLVAMQAALQAPQRVNRLGLIASTPCFVRRPDWQSAMLPALLDTFSSELENDYARTLQRFLSLQVRGSAHASEVLRDLRARLLARNPPQLDGLRAGLEILRATDLRPEAVRIRQPVLLLAGERDTLVPLRAVQAAAALFPDARCQVMPQAGHAPFIAAPAGVVRHLQDFFG